MERTVERTAALGMGWKHPGGLSYHLTFLLCFHHFGLCLACGCRGNREGSWGRGGR